MLSTERIYVDKDGNRVAESSPEAAFLFCSVGKEVSDEDAARLGLFDVPVDDTSAVSEADAAATFAGLAALVGHSPNDERVSGLKVNRQPRRS